jgi:hypothetical protein
MTPTPDAIYDHLIRLNLVGPTVAEARAEVEAAGGRFYAYAADQRAIAASYIPNGVTVKLDSTGHITSVITIGRPGFP